MITDFTLASLAFLIEENVYNPKIKAVARTMGCILSIRPEERITSNFKEILERNTDPVINKLTLKLVEQALSEGLKPDFQYKLNDIAKNDKNKEFKVRCVHAKKEISKNPLNGIISILKDYPDNKQLQCFANEVSLRTLQNPLNDKFKITLADEIKKWRDQKFESEHTETKLTAKPINVALSSVPEEHEKPSVLPTSLELDADIDEDWPKFVGEMCEKHPEANNDFKEMIKECSDILEAAAILSKENFDKDGSNLDFINDVFGTKDPNILLKFAELSEEDKEKKVDLINKLKKSLRKMRAKRKCWAELVKP